MGCQNTTKDENWTIRQFFVLSLTFRKNYSDKYDSVRRFSLLYIIQIKFTTGKRGQGNYYFVIDR